jgi:antitoxin CptB
MPESPSDALATRRRRLLFRATHRGTHENDLMIGGFVRAHLASFGPDELDALETLLEWPETDLADWLTGRRPLPDDAPPMLQRMRGAVVGGAETAPPLAGGGWGEGASGQSPSVTPPPPNPLPKSEGESVPP